MTFYIRYLDLFMTKHPTWIHTKIPLCSGLLIISLSEFSLETDKETAKAFNVPGYIVPNWSKSHTTDCLHWSPFLVIVTNDSSEVLRNGPHSELWQLKYHQGHLQPRI